MKYGENLTITSIIKFWSKFPQKTGFSFLAVFLQFLEFSKNFWTEINQLDQTSATMKRKVEKVHYFWYLKLPFSRKDWPVGKLKL